MSSSKSSSRSTTQNFDRRIAGESSLIATEGSTINVTDVSAGTIEKALGFATVAQKESARLSEAALDRAFDSTAGGSSDLIRQLITFGAVAAVAVVVVRAAPGILRG